MISVPPLAFHRVGRLCAHTRRAFPPLFFLPFSFASSGQSVETFGAFPRDYACALYSLAALRLSSCTCMRVCVCVYAYAGNRGGAGGEVGRLGERNIQIVRVTRRFCGGIWSWLRGKKVIYFVENVLLCLYCGVPLAPSLIHCPIIILITT